MVRTVRELGDGVELHSLNDTADERTREGVRRREVDTGGLGRSASVDDVRPGRDDATDVLVDGGPSLTCDANGRDGHEVLRVLVEREVGQLNALTCLIGRELFVAEGQSLSSGSHALRQPRSRTSGNGAAVGRDREERNAQEAHGGVGALDEGRLDEGARVLQVREGRKQFRFQLLADEGL